MERHKPETGEDLMNEETNRYRHREGEREDVDMPLTSSIGLIN